MYSATNNNQSFIHHLKAHWIFSVCLFISMALLGYWAYHNELWEGGPDNIWHYYFSRYSWTHPDFFLHHWGKPLFILLSSPFAQLGFYGVQIFNLICTALTVIICYRLLGRTNVQLRWLIVPLLLFAPIYFMVAQTSLTEPLFGLLLTWAIYLIFTERFIAGALVVSFLMFARSEGSFLLVYFMVYLLMQRRWKAVPFLFTGFLIYAVWGVLAGHGFWWFFTENPYAAQSPYGHGHWLDILKRYNSIWGFPMMILCSVSILVLLYAFFKNRQYLFWKPLQDSGRMVYLVLGPALVFTAFHLILWHFGLWGSAGLERMLACVMPCYALVAMWSMNKVFLSRFPKGLSLALAVTFLYFHIHTPFKIYTYPTKAWGAERVELSAADWFRKAKIPANSYLSYAFPNILLYLDRNPFDRTLNNEQNGGEKDCKFDRSRPNYLVWDSVFSKGVYGLSWESVEACGFTKMAEYEDWGVTLKIYYLPPLGEK